MLRTALKARDGDRIALEGLLRLVQTDVWRTCRYLVDEESAEDLTQEVLIRVVGSLHRITPDHQIRGWVIGIARHVCFDEIRRRQRRRRTHTQVSNLSRSEAHQAGSDIAVRELVERLDPDRRDVFVLTQLVGLSYEEAAEVCNCPIGTVRSRVARARIELQQLLSESTNPTDAGTLPPPRTTGTA